MVEVCGEGKKTSAVRECISMNDNEFPGVTATVFAGGAPGCTSCSLHIWLKKRCGNRCLSARSLLCSACVSDEV